MKCKIFQIKRGKEKSFWNGEMVCLLWFPGQPGTKLPCPVSKVKHIRSPEIHN